MLLVNFEMDDASPVLAWQARVARGLAERCDRVVVLTERLGDFRGAPNLTVERVPVRPLGVPWRVGGKWFANAHVWKLCRRHRVDVCFVHMAHEWVYRLSPALHALGVPVLLWYAHGSVSRRLRLSHALADRVVTSTPEGFRIPSRKVRVIGQGIDTELFRPMPAPERDEVLYVGRIAPRKQVDLLVSAMAEVARSAPELPVRLRLVGPTLTEQDRVYEAALRERVQREGLGGRVVFHGQATPAGTAAAHARAFLHVNVSRTGSMDKTVLEALACGCPVLTSNEAFGELFRGRPEFVLDETSPAGIARRVVEHYRRRDTVDRAALRALVVGRHDHAVFLSRVVAQLAELAAPHADRHDLAHA